MLLESVANDLAIRIDGAWRSGEICARVEGSVVPTEPEFAPGQSRVGPSRRCRFHGGFGRPAESDRRAL